MRALSVFNENLLSPFYSVSQWNEIFEHVKASLVTLKTAFNFTAVEVSFWLFYHSYYWLSSPTTCAKFLYPQIPTCLLFPLKTIPASLPESLLCHHGQCLEPVDFQQHELQERPSLLLPSSPSPLLFIPRSRQNTSVSSWGWATVLEVGYPGRKWPFVPVDCSGHPGHSQSLTHVRLSTLDVDKTGTNTGTSKKYRFCEGFQITYHEIGSQSREQKSRKCRCTGK